MRKVLVLGATGLTGRRLAAALVQRGFDVRCSVRSPEKAKELLPPSCEIVTGDIADAQSMRAACRSVEGVFICVHTLSRQAKGTPEESYVETELRGLNNVVTACREHGVKRVLYVTFLNASPDSPSAWSRGRWNAEQMLLKSGLDATVLRPGQIVGRGGWGFEMTLSQARRRVAVVFGSGKQRMQNIAVDDLANYLIWSLDEPRTFGQVFDVGSDDVLSADEMIDTAAAVLGRPKPRKIHLSPRVFRLFSGFMERLAKLPKGSFRDMLPSMDADMVGETSAIRGLFPQPPLTYRRAVEKALHS